ncbi:hypothetical protein T440DRAFT_90020 [Plenodomus tracheiphilus IPT5]|uniref:Apple domain-containing protein n=1 Tax=Plenodomus tracheiphilus IPT5 TaxID=1408161 RepID=A0A6A7B4Y8_9PLEO|nr:hypothetical protein T440DRAFT_90020 [Plenodomus tracheiphilus IPT5]
MMLSWKTSVLALTWCSVVVATPLSEGTIFSRALDPRQNVTSKCPEKYTSKNGLNFTTFCGKNNPFNDALPSFPIPTMEECLERCSRYRGEGEGCFGVVWVEADNACWLRNSSTSTAGLSTEGTGKVHSAFIESNAMDPLPITCPNSDLSINKLPGVSGLEYTTHCNKVIGSEFNTCWSGYPKPCLNNPYEGFFHATSLEACLQFCVDQHPLCRGVSWNPDFTVGFANCFPKTGFKETLSAPAPDDKKLGTIHSATITQLDAVDRTCPGRGYTSTNNARFDIYCGQLNTGTNVTSVHVQNGTACMEACAQSEDKCTGVLFDPGMGGGFNNCYLQNSTGVVSDQAGATYAAMQERETYPASTGQDDSSSSSSSSSESKAWIAGPVVGGVVGFAIIGFAAFWWRRRKSNAAETDVVEKSADNHEGYNVAPAYSPGLQHEAQQAYYDVPVNEMEATRPTGELDGRPKYAQKGVVAQELP